MKSLDRMRLAVAALALTAHTAFANTFTTDLTDLWWNANESGWGVTATHQREVVFLTFFVYAADGRATFYTASVTYAGTTGQGALVFTGPMYQTTGPWFGTVFNPNAVGVRQVGTANFTAFIDSATLAYTVDGVTVNKNLTRQTFRSNDLTGGYGGVTILSSSGCANPGNAGTSEFPVGVSINTTGSTFSMTLNDGSGVCNYSGNYVQTGRMGRSQGTYTCPGVAGTYDIFEIEANPSGLTARFTEQNNLCSQIAGKLAAVKR